MKKIFVTVIAVLSLAYGLIGMNKFATPDSTEIETTMIETIEEVETTTEVIETTTEIETTESIEEVEDDVKHMIHINHDMASGRISIDW